jgi:hypothetical protein
MDEDSRGNPPLNLSTPEPVRFSFKCLQIKGFFDFKVGGLVLPNQLHSNRAE